MKTYTNIEEFILENFPLEHKKITKQKKSEIEAFIEVADVEFDQKLEAIIKGEKKNDEK